MLRQTLPYLWFTFALCAAALTTAPARADGYHLSKVALDGEAAPGTDSVYAFSFTLPTLNESGRVGFVTALSGGTVGYGAFRGDAGGVDSIAVVGDPAPGIGGSFAFLTGFPILNDAGQLSFIGIAPGGTPTSGLFVDSGASETVRLVPGSVAPDTGGGTYEANPADLNRHALNGSGDVTFFSDVLGSDVTSGIFVASAGGDSSVALEGDPAPGTGGGSYASFSGPSVNTAGSVVFGADVAGGAVTSGIFRAVGATDSKVALRGDPAPDTGGGVYDLLLMPVVGDGGHVAFFAGTTGGSVAGGVFLDSGATHLAVVVENGTAPGTGGGTYTTLSSLPTVDAGGRVVFSALLTGGSVPAGIFIFDPGTGETAPVLLAGETAPDSGGQTLDAFGYLATNDRGEIATMATLSGGGQGLFLLQPLAEVPALPGPGLWVLALALVSSGGALLRSRVRSR